MVDRLPDGGTVINIGSLAADHHLAGERSIDVCSLRGEPFVLWPRWHSPRLYDQTFSESGSLGFAPRIAQQANGIHANLALVAAWYQDNHSPCCGHSSTSRARP